MKQGDDVTWCEWHQHWAMTFLCGHCAAFLPACYVAAHLRYACAEFVPA